MKRKDALNWIKYAGYHNDTKRGLRLYIENKVSYENYLKYFRLGQELKKKGMKCNCLECKGGVV